MNNLIYNVKIVYINDFSKDLLLKLLSRLSVFDITYDSELKELYGKINSSDIDNLHNELNLHCDLFREKLVEPSIYEEPLFSHNGRNIIIHDISFGYIPGDCDIVDTTILGIPGSPWDKYTNTLMYYLKPYIHNSTRFIDLGCGRGNVCFFANKLGATDIIGLDNNHVAIDICNKSAAINSVNNIKFIEMNIFDYINSEDKELFDTVSINLEMDVLNNLIGIIHTIMNDGAIAVIDAVNTTNLESIYNLINSNNEISLVDTFIHKDIPIIIVQKGQLS